MVASGRIGTTCLLPSTSTSYSNGSEWPHRHDVLVAVHLDGSGQQREERRTQVYHALIHDQNVHRLNNNSNAIADIIMSLFYVYVYVLYELFFFIANVVRLLSYVNMCACHVFLQ